MMLAASSAQLLQSDRPILFRLPAALRPGRDRDAPPLSRTRFRPAVPPRSLKACRLTMIASRLPPEAKTPGILPRP